MFGYTTIMVKYILTVVILAVCAHTSAQLFFPETHVNTKGKVVQMFKPPENSECIKLRQCPALIWLRDHQNSIAGVRSDKILKGIRSKRCMVEDSTSENELNLDTIVSCPITQEAEANEANDYDDSDDYDGYNDDILGLRDDSDYGTRDVFGLLGRDGDSCSGSVAVLHGSRKNPLSTLKHQRFSRKRHPNLRKLKQRTILRLAVDGNCCWRIYSRARFQGLDDYIDAGYDDVPQIRVRSLKQVGCE